MKLLQLQMYPVYEILSRFVAELHLTQVPKT